MNVSYRCHSCGVLTSDYWFVAGYYWCEDHVSEGRKIRATLDRSRAMMGNQNARKKS